MKSVSIVGFGRFGKTLYRLIKDDFFITLYDKKGVDDKNLTENTKVAKSINEIYNSEIIFYCVPIRAFEDVIATHKKYFQNQHVLIDVLSVKMHPAKIFKKYLANSKAQALLTHPMFGPDSSKEGFEGLPLIMDQFTTSDENYQFWKGYFKTKLIRIVEMSAKEHDKMATNSQGLTHFIGRLLEAYHFRQTPIDSLGGKKLLEIEEQTCNDSWQLFFDLQTFNPYTKQMRLRLDKAYDKLYNKLLPRQVNPKFITFGIQGGKGSFNEEAIRYYLKKERLAKYQQAVTSGYRIKYLYTSENVLRTLHRGDLDIGQFAIHTSVGGIVDESIKAMSKYKFKIIQQYSIRISHALMMRKDIAFSQITTIMTHPQTLAQCQKTLSQKYPRLKQISGEKKLIDPSMVAKYLSEGKLPNHIATLGSKFIAEIYNLQIVEDNLQDAKENYTSFLQVSRV